MKKKIIIKVHSPKIRKPIAKKCNSFMRSKKTYSRKNKHKIDKICIAD